MSSASRAAPMKLAADALDKGYSMAWLKMISRSALCGIVGVAALVSEAADLTLGSVAQPKRGEVIARVSYVGSGALQPAALSIRLDADHSVPAASVASAPAVAAPVALLLCLDRSGSMGAPAIGAMQSALRESLAAPGGAASLSFSVAIFAFATRTTPLLNLTNDPARVDAAVANLVIEKERDGKTRLYDAVAGGLAELRASDVASKRLIVVSDGDDEGSHITQAELVKRATSTAIPVDAIGFGALAASRSGSLATIAGATGGSFQVAANNAELTAALGRMIRRTVPAVQYDVTFRYDAAEAGMSESPKLVFKPTTGAAAESPIQVGLAAASGTSVLANVAASGSTPTDITPSGWRALINLTAIQRFAERVPLFAWIGLGVFLLLLIALLLILWRRRHVFAVPAPGPQAGPPFLSPPAAVIGPTRTSVSDDPNLLATRTAGGSPHRRLVPLAESGRRACDRDPAHRRGPHSRPANRDHGRQGIRRVGAEKRSGAGGRRLCVELPRRLACRGERTVSGRPRRDEWHRTERHSLQGQYPFVITRGPRDARPHDVRGACGGWPAGTPSGI